MAELAKTPPVRRSFSGVSSTRECEFGWFVPFVRGALRTRRGGGGANLCMLVWSSWVSRAGGANLGGFGAP